MSNQELIELIKKIESTLPEDSEQWTNYLKEVFFLQAVQFVKTYIGVDTEFYKNLEIHKNYKTNTDFSNRVFAARTVLTAIQKYLQNNLQIWETTSYKIKNDIVSDLLQQANKLLEDTKIHPAAPAILIGAVLEEFLRILANKNSIDLPINKNSINDYAQELYKINVLTKQDIKDIGVWSGLRNDATHGRFDEVNDRKRISLSLEGVNLFMRKLNQNV